MRLLFSGCSTLPSADAPRCTKARIRQHTSTSAYVTVAMHSSADAPQCTYKRAIVKGQCLGIIKEQCFSIVKGHAPRSQFLRGSALVLLRDSQCLGIIKGQCLSIIKGHAYPKQPVKTRIKQLPAAL